MKGARLGSAFRKENYIVYSTLAGRCEPLARSCTAHMTEYEVIILSISHTPLRSKIHVLSTGGFAGNTEYGGNYNPIRSGRPYVQVWK